VAIPDAMPLDATSTGARTGAYLPQDMPVPEPTPDDRPFWEACARRELRIQCCTDCGRFRHPPAPFCADCRSPQTAWKEVSGDGTVFSYTIAHFATHPALRDALPYNIAVVLLDGTGDVRLISNVVDVPPEGMAIGLPVRLVWEPTRDGGYLPRFARRPDDV
jgi:uncharacterized OB-fold protein